MFPKYETIETDYMIGMVWSKEDLIAPFSFPIYKSENVYKNEVEDARSSVFPVFDINNFKTGGSNWLDSLDQQFSKIVKVVDYYGDLQKEKTLPEEKRTTSEQTLSKLKTDLGFNYYRGRMERIKQYFE